MYFNSYEEHTSMVNGKQQTKIMEVKVKNGKGIKKVTIKNKNSRPVSHEEELGPEEIDRILGRKFVPGLFQSCNEGCLAKAEGMKAKLRSKSHRTRRHKK